MNRIAQHVQNILLLARHLNEIVSNWMSWWACTWTYIAYAHTSTTGLQNNPNGKHLPWIVLKWIIIKAFRNNCPKSLINLFGLIQFFLMPSFFEISQPFDCCHAVQLCRSFGAKSYWVCKQFIRINSRSRYGNFACIVISLSFELCLDLSIFCVDINDNELLLKIELQSMQLFCCRKKCKIVSSALQHVCAAQHLILSLQFTHVIQLKRPFLYVAGMQNNGGCGGISVYWEIHCTSSASLVIYESLFLTSHTYTEAVIVFFIVRLLAEWNWFYIIKWHD